jgi:hypothetical protein
LSEFVSLSDANRDPAPLVDDGQSLFILVVVAKMDEQRVGNADLIEQPFDRVSLVRPRRRNLEEAVAAQNPEVVGRDCLCGCDPRGVQYGLGVSRNGPPGVAAMSAPNTSATGRLSGVAHAITPPMMSVVRMTPGTASTSIWGRLRRSIVP